MAAIEPYPRAPRDPDRDAATITRLRKEIADLKAAALTPPEGYVLVPVKPSAAMLSAGKNVNQECEEDDPSWGVADVWNVMLAARPEIPND